MAFGRTDGPASRVLWLAILLPFALALAVYGGQARQTPLLNPERAAADRYLADLAAQPGDGDHLDAAAATEYWTRYPDVAGDSYYGPDGPLGMLGAIQHYRDHGRREGRQWQ
jgi:hypothetical protein